MSKLSFRARALDASKPMPIYLAEELPDLPDYSAINRAVPQMPSGMEKEEESEHHLQRAISGTGLIIPTPEVCEVTDLEFYERCYPPDYKMPKQHIHMQPLWEEQEAPEYDIDSEDERWLRQQRHAELTEWKFEQMMDKLEKSSGQTVVTLNEAKLLLERHDDLVTAVYDYWLNKRLNTQHPLILSVKTESRPGQSSNNPYLAFRRRTEKMQTRKNRKNDESSYEKMLKLRRDLARALTLLELVARRETAKRELVRLTASLAERRYAAGDFASQLLPDPPPRPQYTSVPIAASSFRAYSAPHYPPRALPTPVDIPRQREKRPYKRKKIRHPAVGSVPGLREAGVCSSSEEESSRTEAPPVDDGPFAFRRKPGCYYEMPTSTLCGDPLDSDKATNDTLYDHELDERNRYTLVSLNHPYPHCIGFARRRLGRGGRVLLDRTRTPLDELWPTLPFTFPDSETCRRQRHEEVELETKAHRTPKEMTRDYHTGGKYPWRHAFRRHLKQHPHLWTEETTDDCPMKEIKDEPKDDWTSDQVDSVRDIRSPFLDFKDIKEDPFSDIRREDFSVKSDDPKDTTLRHPLTDYNHLSDSVSEVNSDRVRTIDCNVRDNLRRVMRKRAWSGCSDGSYESDESLQPAEKEFEKFIDEVNDKWLHFRPKTPSPSPSPPPSDEDAIPITLDTPLSVELHSQSLGAFTSSEFTLGSLCDRDVGLTETRDDFTALTVHQAEAILSETDLKALSEGDLPDPDISESKLVELVEDKDPFLCRGARAPRPAPAARAPLHMGSTTVQVSPLPRETMYMETVREPPKVIEPPPKIKEEKIEITPVQQPVPTSKIIVEEVNEVPQVKTEKKKKEVMEEVQLSHGVQLKTVQTKHSPLKKHIITAARRRPSEVAVLASQDSHSHSAQQPQIVTVAVSDSLKVRLQNHLLSSQSGVLVQNGPFPPVAVAVPVQQARDAVSMASVASVATVASVGVAGTTMSPRRVSSPLVQLGGGVQNKLSLPHPAHPPAHHLHHAQTHTPLVVAQSHTIHHVAPNKLKVLHAHPLTQSQRSQLLAQNRSIAGLPAVVSLSPLADGKGTNAALLKAAPQGVAQFFEIKSGQLGKGPHLVNVVRQPQPGKTTVSRLELNDAKKRQVVALDGTALKGNITTAARPHRVSLSLDGRQLVRAALPTVRTPHVRHQIQLKNRTLQVTTPIARSSTEPSSSIACIPSASKAASIPSSVVANLLQKNVSLPKGTQKIGISAGGQALSANVQAIAFTTAQLKARQARLVPDQRHAQRPELVEASTVAASPTAAGAVPAPLEGRPEPTDGSGAANGAVRRRAADTVPMEVT